MQINPHVQASSRGPLNGLVQVLGSSLDVWITLILLKSPVADWYPYKIQACASNLLEISLCGPRGPVRL